MSDGADKVTTETTKSAFVHFVMLELKTLHKFIWGLVALKWQGVDVRTRVYMSQQVPF